MTHREEKLKLAVQQLGSAAKNLNAANNTVAANVVSALCGVVLYGPTVTSVEILEQFARTLREQVTEAIRKENEEEQARRGGTTV